MASIHRNPRSPRGVWYAHYYCADGTRVSRSTGTRDKNKARIICEAWAAAEAAVAGGHGTKDRITEILNETLKRVGVETIERISITQWLTQWLASKTEISSATRLAYEQVSREFLAFLGPRGAKRRLESIDERDIRGFMAQLASEGRAPGTINKLVRKYLSTAFEKARFTGRITHNPIRAIDPKKISVSTRDTFTPEQVAELLKHADTDWQGAILLAYSTGARLQDIANMRWSNLDIASGVVSFTQRKTGRKTVVGLHTDFLEWVSARDSSDDPQAYLFRSLGGRSGAGRNGLSRAFESIMRRAGIAGGMIRERKGAKGRSLRSLSFHSFRHGAATVVFNAAALKEIARRVTGHAKTGEVDRYIHEDIAMIRAATELIPRLPRGSK